MLLWVVNFELDLSLFCVGIQRSYRRRLCAVYGGILYISPLVLYNSGRGDGGPFWYKNTAVLGGFRYMHSSFLFGPPHIVVETCHFVWYDVRLL